MRIVGWGVVAGFVLVALAAGLFLGATGIPAGDVLRALLDPSAAEAPIVRGLRLPRVLLAFMVGGALGVSGAALQALIRNPLADPYLLGLSGGAGLGAVAAMALQIVGAWAVPLFAFLGALGAVALVYRLSVVAGRRLDPRILLLAGVIVGAFSAAIMTTIITLSPADQLRNAFLWLLGGFSAASWNSAGLFVGYATIPLALLMVQARALDLLTLGEEPALTLGTDVERLKRIVLVATSLLTAAGVAVCGVIGFVGLVVPHALRGLIGPLHGRLLPAAFLAGGAFLVLADAAARTLVRPIELPVGVVTALVGVPLFAVLLRRSVR
ncbi:MAG TPA: iron ABC transporter permease [Gemmatimonadales bacterium]|nr:iron ABC transporter permease [Gemmatimonadales bacterium]